MTDSLMGALMHLCQGCVHAPQHKLQLEQRAPLLCMYQAVCRVTTREMELSCSILFAAAQGTWSHCLFPSSDHKPCPMICTPHQGWRVSCREKLGRAAEALQDVRRAAELEPHNAEARQAVSRLQEPPPPPPLSHAVSEGGCPGGTSAPDGHACAKHEPISVAGGEASRQIGGARGGVAAEGNEDEMLP